MLSLLKYLKKHDWALLTVCIGLIVMQVWLELKMPEYTYNLTNIVQSQSSNMNAVWKNGGLMLACAAGSLASAILCSILISRIASSFSMSLRKTLFDKISTFSSAELKQFSTSSLITRTTNDVMQMQNFMAMGVQLLFKAPIMAIWAIAKISATNIKWTTAVIISVAIIVICITILISICLPRFRKIQKLTDDINNITRENVSGVRVIRAFNADDFQAKKFENINNKIKNNHLFSSRAMGFMFPIITLVMNGLTLSIYWIGALLINEISFAGDINLMVNNRGLLIANMSEFSQYAMQVVMSFMMLILIFIILPRTLVSAKRIAEVLKVEPSIQYKDQLITPLVTGEIEFKNVSFSYQDAKSNEKTLSNISFKVNRGETLAIIGSTGSSKTTLINLIPRFYDVTDGEVLVNGINVKEYSEEDLQSRISIASQKAVLFKGSIKDNIVYGSEEIDEEKINNVINIAKADFVYELKNGIDSHVAQGGTNFSGGQKQRLSIARALYKDSEIIIFDDTFSALDYKTDMIVRKNIKEKYDDRTIIIVAQRIGTIKNADKIIVLDNGKIMAIGKHEELLNSCKIYKEIALSQLSKEEL